MRARRGLEQNLTKKSEPIFLFLILVASTIVIVLHGYLGSHTRLLADDFCSVYFAERLGMLRYIWYWYLTWGGRYSAIASDWFIYPIGANGVRFVPPAILVIWLTVTTATVWKFLKREFSTQTNFLTAFSTSALLLFLILVVGPSTPQTLYWWNGMRTYTLPLILLLACGFTFMVLHDMNLHSRWFAIIGFGFSIVLGGYNETFTAIMLAFFSLLIVIHVLSKRGRSFDTTSYFLLAGLLGMAVSLVIMLVSPGVEKRQEFFPPHPDLPDVLAIAFGGYRKYLLDFLSAPEKVAALLGGMLTAGWMGIHSENDTKFEPWLIPVPAGGGILLSYAVVLPAVYSMSEPPAPRTMIISSFAIIMSFLFTSFLAGKHLRSRYEGRQRAAVMIALATGLILFSSLQTAVGLYNNRTVFTDYARQWDAANAQIIQAKLDGDDSVTIPAVPNWAGLEVLNDNPKYWVNACYTLYYKIQVFGAPAGNE